MKRLMPSVLLLLLGSVVFAQDSKIVRKPEMDVFYIYKDQGSRENHYIPSGWMGSYKSLKYTGAYKQEPKEGTSCIQVKYDVSKDTETFWSGIYFQSPVNNWGDKRGGWDLSGFKKLTFWVKGNGYIDKFMMGGITGITELGDSGESYVEGIELTPEWKKVEIDLKGIDLSYIIGGFGFAVSADYNPKNVILFIDEIVYQK